MMRNRLFALLLLAFVVFATGCQGFLADRKISSIEKIVAELQALHPDVHASAGWESLKNELAATKQLRQNDAASANTKAAAVLDQAKALRDEVKVAEANALYGTATEDVGIMGLNNAQNVNAEKYTQIQDAFAKVGTAQSNAEWQDVIEDSKLISGDVRTILTPLEQEAKRLLNELNSERREMDRFECQIYAPEMVATVDGTVKEVEELIDKKRHYTFASDAARRGIREAQNGITKSNTIRSQIQINQLEERLTKAVDEGAEIFAHNRFQQVVTSFDTVVQDFINDEFERVLQTIQILRPQVDDLIFRTLTNSTQEKLSQLRALIERHREGGVEIYLKGRLDRLVEKVDAASADFAVTSDNPEQFPVLPDEEKQRIEESFANIKAQVQEAFILSEKIDSAFDDLTGAAIRDAEFALNVAQELFGKVEGAFMKRTPADVTPLDSDFTFRKDSLQGELGQRLGNSQELLRQAKSDRANAQYRQGIETARRVERTADFIQSQIYRLVADNAILELENQITRFTGEGAQEFAAEDLQKTRESLDQAKAMMTAEQYREASEQAARVRAQLDVTLQVLSRATLTKIEEADAAIIESENLRANEFAPEPVGRARGLAEQARNELTAKSYRSAVQHAEAALSTAKEASTEAGLAWSRNEIEKARQAQDLAESAGAVAYAPLLLRRAQNQYATSRELRDANLYRESAVTAQEAKRSFDAATYKMINDANEAILTSRRSEGWKYESDELTKAIVKAEKAQQLLESGSYDESRRMAEESRALAEEVTQGAQTAGIQERIARIKRSFSGAERSGANYFQVAEVKRLLGEAEQLKKSVRDLTYEDQIEALNRIEAELEIVLASTDDQVATAISSQRAKLDHFEKDTRAGEIAAERIAAARGYLNYLEIDFQEKAYPRAYKNLRLALDEIDAIEAAVAEQEYQIRITKLFRELSTALNDFDAVISIGPDVLRRLAFGIDGRGQTLAIANSYPPTQFKQKIDDLYLEILAIEAPPTRRTIHQTAVKALAEARLSAAEFQKFLIFDELDRKSIDEAIQNAYAHLKKMETYRSDLQKRILDAGADLDIVPLRTSRNEGVLLQASFDRAAH